MGGKFNIKNEVTGKKLNIKVEGAFSASDADRYIQEFKANALKIRTKEYELTFDCVGLKVGDAESVAKLESCFVLYKEAEFTKLTLDTGGNTILKMQFNRLGRAAGIPADRLVIK